MPLCIQIRASGAPRAGQRLRRLVLVVREHEVDAAAVDVELHAQQRLGHRRALDVPARPARGPRARPTRCPRPPSTPSTARSRAGPPCSRRPRRPRPGPSGRRRGARARRRRRSDAHAEVHVAVGRVGVRRARSARAISSMICPIVLGRVAARRPAGRARAGRCPRCSARPSPRASSADGTPCGARRVVDLVVDVGDVRRRASRRSPRARGSA